MNKCEKNPIVELALAVVACACGVISETVKLIFRLCSCSAFKTDEIIHLFNAWAVT